MLIKSLYELFPVGSDLDMLKYHEDEDDFLDELSQQLSWLMHFRSIGAAPVTGYFEYRDSAFLSVFSGEKSPLTNFLEEHYGELVLTMDANLKGAEALVVMIRTDLDASRHFIPPYSGVYTIRKDIDPHGRRNSQVTLVSQLKCYVDPKVTVAPQA